MNLQEKINAIEVGRIDLLKYRFGVITGVLFQPRKVKLNATAYEAEDKAAMYRNYYRNMQQG